MIAVVRFVDSTKELQAVTEFPGLPVWYSVDDGVTWSEYKPGTTLQNDVLCRMPELQLVTR